MKRLIACSVLLAGIYGCERICGDLQPAAEITPMGGAGAGGDGGATAGEGGASPVPAGTGPGGVPSEGGGGAGGAAGAVSCSPPPSDKIIDFEDAPSSPALGEMMTDPGEPDRTTVIGWNSSTVYHEGGGLPDQEGNGFTFTFNVCVDVSEYVAIRFEVEGATPAGVDVSIRPRAATSIHFVPVRNTTTEVCVPIAEDQKERVLDLRFLYTPRGSANPEVDLDLDNFVFSPDPCSAT